MNSTTRRGFIRRGLAGAAAFGSLPKAAYAESKADPSNPAAPAVQTPDVAEFSITPTPVRTGFGGVGFHAQMLLADATQDFEDQVLAKRWRELNPRFARIFHT